MRKTIETIIAIGAVLITVGIYASQVRRNTKDISVNCDSISSVTLAQGKLESSYEANMPWILSGLEDIKIQLRSMEKPEGE